jgi:hypothetical protein
MARGEYSLAFYITWYVGKQFGEQNFRGHAYSLISRVDNMSQTIKHQQPALANTLCMYLHSPATQNATLELESFSPCELS